MSHQTAPAWGASSHGALRKRLREAFAGAAQRRGGRCALGRGAPGERVLEKGYPHRRRGRSVVVGQPIVIGREGAGEGAGTAAEAGAAGALTLEGAPDIGLAEAAEEAAGRAGTD